MRDTHFLEAIYYAMREGLNGELDSRHNDLICQAIEYFEDDEFPAALVLCDAELLALTQTAKRRCRHDRRAQGSG